jgi:hypothetical protein
LFDESDGSDASACCNEPQFPNTPNNGGEFPGSGGGRTGAVLLSPFIDPGTLDTVAYNHFTLLRSVEDVFGLGHLGFAGMQGLQSLGSDVFTCYAGQPSAPRHGRLAAGSEIKLAVIGQGTGSRPMIELKLWHAGAVTVQVKRLGHGRRHRGRQRRRHGHRGRKPAARRLHWHRVGGTQALTPCQLLKVALPYRHGRVRLSASAFGGVERRTLTF